MLLLQAPLSSENEAMYHVLNDILELTNARVYPSLVPDRCVDKSLCGGALYLWILRMKHASWHPSGPYNFEVALDFWKICASQC